MTSSRDARELYELKQKATKYYAENGVPQKMEEIMNDMFYDNPDDVYGHLANYFAKLAKTPTISKVQARPAFDSKGQTTMQTEIYCKVRNLQKLASTTESANPNSSLPENAKVEDRDEDDKVRENNVTAALTLLNNDINNRLQGLDPSQQTEADSVIKQLYQELKVQEDERLAKEAELAAEEGEGLNPPKDIETASQTSKKGKSSAKPNKSTDKKGKGKATSVVVVPEDPKEKLLPGAGAVSAVSKAVCSAAACLNDVPLYHHIATLKKGEVPPTTNVPIPMVTIIQSGRPAPGKLNCVKEFMVMPKPGMPLEESLKHIQKIYNYVMKNFFTKGGVAARLVNDIGALCPNFDRPEQGLDILQEAMTSLELTPGEDFFIALNCAAHEIFDYEKGKYEVLGGQAKVPEDVVEFWAELLGRYPSVVALIDPLRRQETEHWMRLCERISEKCYVIGNHAYKRPGILLNEDLTEEFKTSGIVFKLDNINTMTDIIECAKKMEAAENQLVITSCHGETTDTFLADLAVGLNARFIKVGAPMRGERVGHLNRLLQIEHHLKMEGKLSTHGADVFPHITPPPLPEPEEGEEAKEEEKKEEKGKKK